MTATAPPWPDVSENPATQANYESMRTAGESHNLAEMLAFQQGPGLQTDTTWLRGNHDPDFPDTPMGKLQQETLCRNAKAANINPHGKTYKRSLAEYPCDPHALVNTKGDVKRRCETKGWSCEGAVNVKGPEIDRTEKQYRVADDLVDQHTQAAINEDKRQWEPGEVKELHQATRERLTPEDGDARA